MPIERGYMYNSESNFYEVKLKVMYLESCENGNVQLNRQEFLNWWSDNLFYEILYNYIS